MPPCAQLPHHDTLHGALVGHCGERVRHDGVAQQRIDRAGLLAVLTSPVIALLIGYEMRREFSQLGASLRTVLIRLAIWLPLGMLFSMLFAG